MDAELVINSTSAGVDIALLEDGQLVELHRDRGDVQYAVGDIYVGRVRKVMPNLNAGFVDVGHGKDAFLHHSDLGPQFKTQQIWVKRVMSGKQPTSDISKFKREEDIERKGKMKDYVSASQLVLVQVAKEPISTKGPRLTAEVSLPGRYLVLGALQRQSLSFLTHQRRERAHEVETPHAEHSAPGVWHHCENSCRKQRVC